MINQWLRGIGVASTAAFLLAVAVGGASARSLSSSHQNIRVTWRSLGFEEPIFGIGVRCPVTLEGSFHSKTVAKVERSLVGAVTRAIVKEESCTNGRGKPNTETLPWHLTYENFTGTLPNITTIGLLLGRFSLGTEIPLTGCVGRYGTSTDNISIRGNREVTTGAITTAVTIEGRNTATLERTISGSCPSRGTFQGTGEVFILGSTNRTTITLI